MIYFCMAILSFLLNKRHESILNKAATQGIKTKTLEGGYTRNNFSVLDVYIYMNAFKDHHTVA